ncbi:MAG: tetratricopeptide repeat protein [Spirochaetales bacterium]|nr:MAG: tetratricopeptide repeat protein [Spirochaetales bacterium]
MIRLFRRREPEPAIDDIVQERWESGFSLFARQRFVQENTDAYSAGVSGRALTLALKRKNLFAWANNPWYRYKDFVLEAEASFHDTGAHSALGFLLRYMNDETYFYFLVSNRFLYRFDLVFNGNPIPLIPWTKSVEFDTSRFSLRVIAHGDNFSFYLNNSWLGEIDNDAIDAGGITFAGQNYDEADSAEVSLRNLIIDSIPLNVETQYYRWTQYAEISSSQRLELARSLYNRAQYSGAVVQIKKAAFAEKLPPESFLLMGDSLLRLGLFQEALGAMDKLLEMEPGKIEAVTGTVSCLYALNRYGEMKTFLDGYREMVSGSSVLLNFLGNAELGLGRITEASRAFAEAADLEADVPIFQYNAGRTLFKAKDGLAAGYLVKALRLFFRQEDYDDVRQTLLLLGEALNLPGVENSAKIETEIAEIRGKLLFQEGRFLEAEKIFSGLAEKQYGDSSVYYLLGLIHQGRGEKFEALPFFQKAAEMEPEAGLYWFRLAECLFLSDLDCGRELELALERIPADPWTLNLAGQVRMQAGDYDGALSFLEKAFSINGEPFIRVNYTECLYRKGRKDEAFALLEQAAIGPLVLNQKGNLLTREGQYFEALSAYRKALSLDLANAGIDSVTIRLNMADACIAGDMYSDAESTLVKLLDESPDSRVYLQLGRLAEIKGEFRRAETIYEQALAGDAGNADILLNLGWIALRRNEYEKAKALGAEVLSREVSRLHGTDVSGKAEQLLDAVKQASELVLRCAGCGREWTVPKHVEPQPPVKLHGEPAAESPAGKCTACGSIFCTACAKEHLRNSRFICRDCGEPLKLSDDHLRYLATSFLKLR